MRNPALLRILTVGLLVLAGTPSVAAQMHLQLSGAERIVQWHPGVAQAELQAAQVVRIAPGFRAVDMSSLRDDQMIETPSGNRVAVRKMRLIQQAVIQARARTATLRPGPFIILPPIFAPCTKPAPGETSAQILARPPSDIICTPSGNGVSVAQLRLIAPYAQQRRQMRVIRPPALSGPVIQISSRQDMRVQFHTNLRNAPDSTVLVSPKGTRVTIGQLKALLKSHATTIQFRSNGGRAQ